MSKIIKFKVEYVDRLTFPLSRRYRAEIVAIQVNESMPQELLFDVYFLDYGDSQFISKKDILELRADFLSLRFQAIECFLAHVQPTNERSNLDEWDEKAVEKFEEMVQAAHWKKLISKVVAYKERKSFHFQRHSNNKRESSPIPGVELFDPDQNADKNIALELVKQGFAEMTENFGDLTKSAILNSEPSTNGAQLKVDELRQKSEEREGKNQEQPAVQPVKEQQSPETVLKAASPEREEQSKSPAKESHETNNNSLPKSNGSSDPFKAGTVLKSKNQQLSDFLMNEQKGTSKAAEKVDWNAMLEE